MNELRSIEVVTGVNESGQGFITVTATDQKRNMMLGQLDPATVRDMAMNFLAAAEAAETDAIVYRLLRDRAGLDMETIGAFITDMRNARS